MSTLSPVVKRGRRVLSALFLLAAAPLLAHAQSALPASPPGATTNTPVVGPAVRKIESALNVSTEPFGAITSVRQLADGRVLVNDGTKRRVVLMDSTLKKATVILDSLSDVENTYGTRAGAMIPYRGDSTLFLDPASYAMLVLGPNGNVAKVRAIPSTLYLTYLTSTIGSYGVPGVDTRGRLVFRIPARAAPPAVAPPAGVPYFPPQPDSAFVVRLDLTTRKMDTAGVVRIPKITMTVTMMTDGGYSARSQMNPLPSTDDWAILTDGTIAFVRGRDYRVEWLAPEGGLTSSPKLPFDWVRMDDEAKRHLVDSIKKQQEELNVNQYYFRMLSWVNQYNQEYPKDFKFPPGLVFPTGMPAGWKLPPGFLLPADYVWGPPMAGTPQPLPTAAPPGAVATAGSAAAAAAAKPPAGPALPPGARAQTAAAIADAASKPSTGPAPVPGLPPGMTMPPMPTPTTTSALINATIVGPEELPDYKPPFSTAAARADGDGNLWVRTLPMRPYVGVAPVIYDVINRKGELVDRIQLPSGHTLVGFGAGKIIYLSVRDATGLHLERVKLK